MLRERSRSTYVQRRPRRRGVDRIVEQLLDPCGEQVLVGAIPRVAQRPDASLHRARRRRPVGAHGDLAGDRAAAAALARGSAARHLPAAGDGHLGEPEVGRSAMPPARSRRDRAVRRDQRQLALERLLRGEETRSGTPFHGVTGEGSTAISPASSQPAEPWAREVAGENRRASASACDRQQGRNSSGNCLRGPGDILRLPHIPRPPLNDHGERSG